MEPRRRVQAVIPLGLGEVANARHVAIVGEKPAAGASLLGGYVAFDRFVSRVALQEILDPCLGDDGVPGGRVVAFRTADREDLHPWLGLPVRRHDPAGRQPAARA